MLPAVLIGSNIGVFMNTYLPDLYLSILLSILLLVLTISTAVKARRMIKKENIEIEEAKKLALVNSTYTNIQ